MFYAEIVFPMVRFPARIRPKGSYDHRGMVEAMARLSEGDFNVLRFEIRKLFENLIARKIRG